MTSALVKQIEEDAGGKEPKCIHLYNTSTIKNVLKTFKEELCPDFEPYYEHEKLITFDDIFGVSSTLNSLVIFVYDFENFNKQVLISLILKMKPHIHRFPIIFVMMIQNQMNDSVQYFLPAEATDCLLIEDIEPYYEPKFVVNLFESFISTSTINFKLHPNFIKEMFMHFNNYELSYGNFLVFMQSILFQHYYTNPLSIICGDEDFPKKLKSDKKLLGIFKNSLNVPEAGQLNDSEFVAVLCRDYKQLMVKHDKIIIYINMLIDLGTFCFVTSRSFLYFYIRMVSPDEFDLKEKYLSRFYRVQANVWKNALFQLIQKYGPNPLVETLKEFWSRLDDMIEKEETEENKQIDSAVKMKLHYGLDNDVKLMKTKLRNINSRAELRQNLTPQRSQKELTQFELWKVDIIDSIDAFLKKESVASLKYLINGVFFNDVKFAKSNIFVAFREKIQTALSKLKTKNIYPSRYIIYKLFKDAPREINLYDWYEQFCTEKKLEANCKYSENELIVAFLSTVSDFEFLGLLEASKYKADFFIKQVWF